MDRLYNSFRFKFILLCTAVLLIILVLVYTFVYITAENIIVEQINMSSRSTAVAISEKIMDDIDQYKNFLETRDTHSDYYRDMQKYFNDVKNASNIRYIYTEHPINDDTVEFIIGAEPVGSNLYSPPGQTTFMDSAARAVYATGLPAILEPTVSDYGTLLGGCAPIFDTNRDILGLVGVNVDITEIIAHMNRLRIVMVTIYVCGIAAVLLLLRKYSDRILEPMLKDKLTSAYSKRYMDRLMQEEMKAAAKNNMGLAVMMCDLDHFKRVNDTYGHAFGDVVLASVSKTIITCMRKTDYFFRYGGEEFVVVLSKTNLETTSKIAERIRHSVEEKEFFNRDTGTKIKITVSLGIACLDASIKDWRQLIDNADKAMYEAKKTRNCISVFEFEETESKADSTP